MAQVYNMSNLCFVIEDTDELSQAILEAMACGSIPVLSNISAYKNNFKENENCLYVNQKDCDSYIKIILKYAKKKQEINKKIINNNFRLVEKDYNQEIQMPKIMEMYDGIVN
jgi:glycosyltransferase involved in cell wall biosynthesis